MSTIGVACGPERQSKSAAPPVTTIDLPPRPSSFVTIATSASPDASPAALPFPGYLIRLMESGEVQTRDAQGVILPPRPEDNAVLRGYPRWSDKGPLEGPAGERLTILTEKRYYRAREEIRVIHVHEATRPGTSLYVMGPKAIYGEYLDGVLASRAAAAPPMPYDGAVVESPWEDHNYEVSTYRLTPGDHVIEWRYATLSGPTVLRSNALKLRVD
jgi:hypothetical protein